jgi:hypothetical protein
MRNTKKLVIQCVCANTHNGLKDIVDLGLKKKLPSPRQLTNDHRAEDLLFSRILPSSLTCPPAPTSPNRFRSKFSRQNLLDKVMKSLSYYWFYQQIPKIRCSVGYTDYQSHSLYEAMIL